MCDAEIYRAEARARQQLALSRRDFNLLTLAAGAIAALPTHAAPLPTRGEAVRVPTPDGEAAAYLARPAQGRHPAVLMWPDWLGPRPAYEKLAEQLAASGYAVLLLNPYFRWETAPLVDKADLSDAATIAKVRGLVARFTPDLIARDSQAYLAFMDQQPGVAVKRRAGVFGYCAGGRQSFYTAAAVPGRVGALASFHGGGLVTAEPNSPHKRVSQMRAQALVAIAANDDAKEPAAKAAVQQAFADARLAAEVQVYAGTQHGWCTPDMTTLYDAAQAQRAWARLLHLFGQALT